MLCASPESRSRPGILDVAERDLAKFFLRNRRPAAGLLFRGHAALARDAPYFNWHIQRYPAWPRSC